MLAARFLGGLLVLAPPILAHAQVPLAGTVSVDADRPRDDAPAADDPSPVTIIDLSQPGQRGAARSVSLAEVLQGEAGVRVRSAGGLGQYSAALLRGAASTEVAVLIDGVPLAGGGQSTIDLSQIPVDGLARVEIYRGVPPLEFGVDAIGGAINLVTRRGGPRIYSVVLGGGSFGLRKVSATYSGSHGPIAIAANLAYHGASGDFPYSYTDGLLYSSSPPQQALRQNDGFDQLAADLALTTQRGAWALRMGGHAFLKRQGIAGIGQPGADPGDPTLDTGRALLTLGATGRLLGGRLDLLIDGHALLQRQGYSDLGVTTPTLTEQLGGQAGVLTQVRAALRPDQLLLASLDGRYERFRSEDLCPPPISNCNTVRATDSDRGRLVASLGGDLRIDDDLLVFQPGGQLLYARSRLLPASGDPAVTRLSGPAESTALFLSPRIGARLRLWQRPGFALLLRTSGGRFVRLPTFQELFGDPRLFTSSIGLQPESAWVLEFGLRGVFTRGKLRLQAEANAFGRLVDNFIDLRYAGGGFLQASNIGEVRMLGSEVEVHAALAQALALRLAYSFLDARDHTDTPDRYGNLLPSRPRHALSARADGGVWAVRLFYQLDYTGALFLDPANLMPRPPHTLHAVGLRLGPQRRLPLTLEIEIQNLLDTRLVSIARPADSQGLPALVPLDDYFDFPLPGRALYATLTWRR